MLRTSCRSSAYARRLSSSTTRLVLSSASSCGSSRDMSTAPTTVCPWSSSSPDRARRTRTSGAAMTTLTLPPCSAAAANSPRGRPGVIGTMSCRGGEECPNALGDWPRGYQAFLDRVERGLGARPQAQLVQNAADVGARRALTDGQPVSELSVRQPGCDQDEDLTFPAGEGIDAGAAGCAEGACGDTADPSGISPWWALRMPLTTSSASASLSR